MIADYSQLAIFGVAAVTQILSFAGMFASINVMVWGYGVMMAFVGLRVVAWWMRFFAYEQEYSNKTDATKYSASVKAISKIESKYDAVADAAMTVTFIMQYDNWMYAQYMAMSPEERAAWKGEEVEEEKMEDEMAEEEMTEETMEEGEEAETELFQF